MAEGLYRGRLSAEEVRALDAMFRDRAALLVPAGSIGGGYPAPTVALPYHGAGMGGKRHGDK